MSAFINARVKEIVQILNHYIPTPQVPLKHNDRYTLLIAVLLSARCTDERVNKITPRLFALADTPEAMITLPIATIEEIIRPCGLGPQKARAIWQLSEKLVKEFHGKVPGEFAALESLPGVGHKTASVVMVQGFHMPAFPVDTHIFRCARRWGLSQGTTVAAVERDLKALFPKNAWGRLHLQIILFARRFCPAQRHDLRQCPICSILT